MGLFKRIINKAPKPVKKNTWQRNLMAFELRTDRRYKERLRMRIADDTARTCPNCGKKFEGTFCPHCGQSAVWTRYTWKQAILNFLDIWGLGNRPMFRTIHDLFVRPGFMIRDYLNGHRQMYFPPFKMLAVMSLLLIFTYWITGQKFEGMVDGIVRGVFEGPEEINLSHLPDGVGTVIDYIFKFTSFLSSNPLYEFLFIGVLSVLCIWYAYRAVSRYNLVETYIFLIYVLTQTLICLIPYTLVTGLYQNISEAYLGQHDLFRLLEAPSVRVVLDILEYILYKSLFIIILLWIYDFHQFYALGWRASLRRMGVAIIIGLVLLILTVIFFIMLASNGLMAALVMMFVYVVLIGVAIVGSNFLRENKEGIRRLVRWTSIVAFYMTFILYMLIPNADKVSDKLGVLASSILFAVLFIALAHMSLWPIAIYKKRKLTWPCFVPLVINSALLVLAIALKNA